MTKSTRKQMIVWLHRSKHPRRTWSTYKAIGAAVNSSSRK